ncbi:uncharacterized protein DUF1127 [Aliiruegeria haliotis]|uniref:Uncharacterized protein DUF1127 n=1 Tax=Aliiruegeria haliotis TaxID=1280846 RepID=A0A2T0RXV6_9RHOB|nr:DUF1127 domain-containing protein [Aliiruegeria haliotis]PRY25987.1 uncharacterized protein DUF1127 [Aliiruegeria haliotis]
MEIATQAPRTDAAAYGGWFSNLTETLRAHVRQRRAYSATLRELDALSERDLNDLGLSRAMFHEIAREAARNA